MSAASTAVRRWKRFWPITVPGVPGAGRPGARVRVPTVLQMEAVECGAAALAMILAGFGRVVPLEELRTACGVSRDGSKASNMVKAARAYGLTAQGFKREPAKLREMAGPMILHWNFNHFVVLEGITRGRVYLNDPALGARVVTEAELDEAFTGVVLAFEPGPDFQTGRAVDRMAAALARRLAGAHWALAFVILAGLGLALVGLATPSLTRIFVDEVLIRGVTDWLGPLLFAMGAIAVVVAVLTWLQQRFLLLLETKIAVGGTGRVLWHTLHLSAEFFAQRFAGEIASRVAINDRVARLLSGELATTVLSLMMVCFYALLMTQYDLLLTGICVATAGLNVIGLRYVSRRRVDLSQRLLLDHGKAMGAAMGGLQTIETLKASGTESDFFSRWAGRYAKVVNAEQQLGIQTQVLVVFPPLLLGVSTALFLGLGGTRVIDGHLSMGMLIAFQALMFAFLAPVNLLVQIGGTVQEVKGDLTRLDDVLRAPAQWASDVPPPATEPPRLSGALELVNVTFGYSRLDPPLIENFSLTLRPGSRVALVGGSGCGKSTVARLVAGLYAPWSGEVRFDGHPRAAIAAAILTSSLAVVDQDLVLFEGTITDNVTTWDSTLTEQHVVAAARDAGIDDDIMARMGGYATIVEEGGRNFSGGQRQRLDIARALAGNPTMLVLDEATSALDPTTEHLIDDNIRRRGCTCLIVAHRLSTIRDCDEIVVMDRGQIVQRGSHDVLKTQPGLYARLIAAE